jgi:hypothetical protein
MMESREAAAKAMISYLAGQTDRHPSGASGAAVIIPHESGRNCWDTAPNAWHFSEWGNAAGSTPDKGMIQLMFRAVQDAIQEFWPAGFVVGDDGCFTLRGHPRGLRFGVSPDMDAPSAVAAAKDWLAANLTDTAAG